jgi:hypothetical protein
MARSRNIKPGFFRNADLAELAFEARILFIGLWTIADRDGRLEDRPKQIKIEIFPADNVDCDSVIDDLARVGVVDRYEVGGKRYLHIVNFHKHQNPHMDEKPSTIPDANGIISEATYKPKKHRASTMQAPCENESGTVANVLIPDSRFLIPDSLNKIRDSGQPLPPGDDAAQAQSPDPVPHKKIVELWQAHLPALIQPSKWTQSRASALRARWHEDPIRQSVDWWDKLFAHIAKIDFLCGRAPPMSGRKPFEIDIDWLLKQSNFLKVIEGKYDQ